MTSDSSSQDLSRFAETMVGNSSDYSKEQLDIALAATVMNTGLLSERQLSLALSSWTIHGNVSLADHLTNLELIDQPAQQGIMEQAKRRLAACNFANNTGNGAGTKSVMLTALEEIDPSGVVARLMGVRGVAGAGAIDSTGARESAVRFRLVRKLGQGGLGRVWMAFDEKMKRYVAVKEITCSDNPEALERFRREAEITGRLEHPGIVPIYQLGDDKQTGQAFYAMRFLGKTTLHDSILEYHERRGEGDDDPMLIRRLLTDFVCICQAIGHAHSRKVIHRDLKPENIAIDSFGQVIVIDWGIAKVIDDYQLLDAISDSAAEGGGNNSTMQGQVLGTPLYMAPEQAAGRIDELDERTDIYGLGAILFSILTGYAPHERTREAANVSGHRDLLAAIASHPVPDALEANPAVDPALAAICAKAMARRQYSRYQTSSQLAEDVQRWMAGEPVSAYRERPSQKIARWIQRHRVWSQVIAGAFIVGIVSVAMLAVSSHQSYLAAHQVKFDEMRGYMREIEVQLTATAEELEKDARFMSMLPPIQGIIDARNGMIEGEGEEVWRGRLETIYEGLLRANPDYLAISYATISNASEGKEVVRVERYTSDASYVRRVSPGRLSPYADGDLLTKTATLPPGEIWLSIHQPKTTQTSSQPGVRLLALTPVYDESTGDLFGIVVIESNLQRHLVELLSSIEQSSAEIYVANSSGQLWVSDRQGTDVEIANGDISITTIIPESAEFLKSNQIGIHVERIEGWIADRLLLGATNPQNEVNVFLQLHP